jgi:predicted lipase
VHNHGEYFFTVSCVIQQSLIVQEISSAAAVLNAVNNASVATGSKHVYIVGHSLGGAIALLDAVYLPLHLPGFTFSTSVFGLPRVGNPAFADYGETNI